MKSKIKYEAQSNTSVATFSHKDNTIKFNIDDYVLSIVQNLNPNIPSKRALFIEKKGEQTRISALFPSKIYFNTFNGDTKEKDKKKYFCIKYLNDKTLEHTGLIEALQFKGLLPKESTNTPQESQMRAFEDQEKGGCDV